MSSIGDWIATHVTEPLTELIINSVNALIVNFLNDCVDFVTNVLGNEAELAGVLLDNPYIVEAVKYSIGIALALLVVRIIFNVLQSYTAYSTGSETHPGEILKELVIATIMITTSPWIAKQILYFALSVVDDIITIQAVPDVTNLSSLISGFIFSGPGGIVAPLLIMYLIGIIFIIIILIKISVSAVNVALLMIVGPWMWAFKNELGAAWVKALFSQCFAIPIQIFMIRGAMGTLLATITSGLADKVLSSMLFIGFLWATLKFPAFLQQLVAQTGVGGAIGGAARSVGTGVAMRMIVRR